MEPTAAYELLGRNPSTTFGCQYGDGIAGVDTEVVGPLNPKGVYYGTVWRGEYPASPLVFFNFNKYRPDLPPWRNVSEFVLASDDDGDVSEVTFEGAVDLQGVQITGDLKTVILAATYAHDGVQTKTFSREDVASKRAEGAPIGGAEFRVTEELT